MLAVGKPSLLTCLTICLSLQLVCPSQPARAQFSGLLDNPLSRCQLSHLTTPVSNYLIQFSIHLMSFVENKSELSTGVNNVSEDLTSVIETSRGRFVLKQIDHNSTSDRLEAVGVNASLPFLFFINGFNSVDEYGNVSDTWMFNVAKTFAERKILDGNHGGDLEGAAGRSNLVFITWSLPHYWEVSTVLSLLPAYLKTVAYYERISRFVSGTITNMISFVEERAHWQQTWADRSRRFEFYGRFQFYGHSLGSHIMSDAVMRVHDQTGLKFGRLSGLDPANPCFLSLEHGLSVKRMAAAVEQLYVVHSNAGFAGLAAERADVEVVLNGGTFQPGCRWYDFSCSHARATDILGYLDDQCQMVAYKCSSYQHFKIGACETCESVSHSNDSQFTIHQKPSANCVAINLAEQYGGAGEILAQLGKGVGNSSASTGAVDLPVRQLAEEEDDDDDAPDPDHNHVGRHGGESIGSSAESGANKFRYSSSSGRTETEQQQRQDSQQQQIRYNHYVNTNGNFRTGRKTHCLQHYQVRLLINYRDDSTKHNCPISSFYLSRNDKIRLSLNPKQQQQTGRSGIMQSTKLYDAGGGASYDDTSSVRPRPRRQAASSFRDDSATSTAAPESRLENVIKDSLYTSLVAFEGGPELFVGAQLDNIDLGGLRKCLSNRGNDSGGGTSNNNNVAASYSSGLEFVMDVAFMSNTNQKIRRAFSSILCGQWNLQSDLDEGLVLTLCRPSELANVSQQIDELLDQIKDENFHESWTISLLNSLFSLFTEWEPLKQ